jgi:hypothetical protein
MSIDSRMLFVVRALHCVVESGQDLEAKEVEGLKQIIESVVIDSRNQKSRGIV